MTHLKATAIVRLVVTGAITLALSLCMAAPLNQTHGTAPPGATMSVNVNPILNQAGALGATKQGNTITVAPEFAVVHFVAPGAYGDQARNTNMTRIQITDVTLTATTLGSTAIADIAAGTANTLNTTVNTARIMANDFAVDLPGTAPATVTHFVSTLTATANTAAADLQKGGTGLTALA